MNMMSIKDVEQLAIDNEFSLYRAKATLEKLIREGIDLVDIDQLIRLSNQYLNKSLYYFYVFFDPTDYIIPDKYHEKYMKGVQEKISININQHNDYVTSLDLNQPSILYLYCIIEGHIHYVEINDEMLMNLNTHEEAIALFEKEISDTLSDNDLTQLRINAQSERDKNVEEVREYVLNDEKFQKASNENSRLTYAMRLYEIYPEFEDILKRAHYRKGVFFKETWDLMQQSKERL